MLNKSTGTVDFGAAINHLKSGKCVARLGWNGKGIYLKMQRPDENSKMTLPYIYIVTGGLVSDNPHAPRGTVPWLASQTDMLADDWVIVEPEKEMEAKAEYIGVADGLAFWDAVAAVANNEDAAMRIKGWMPGILVRRGSGLTESFMIIKDRSGSEDFWWPVELEMRSRHWEVWERRQTL